MTGPGLGDRQVGVALLVKHLEHNCAFRSLSFCGGEGRRARGFAGADRRWRGSGR